MTGTSAPSRPASDSSTNPNSPAGASASAQRSAVGFSLPKARPSQKISTNFTASSATSTIATRNQCASTWRGSSSMPIVTKKNPSSTSRKGLM